RQTRKRQTGRCSRNRHLRFRIVPTSQQIAPEFLIGARPLHLIENEFVIIFDRFDDLSELAHNFPLSFCHSERSRGISNCLSAEDSRDVSTPLDITTLVSGG